MSENEMPSGTENDAIVNDYQPYNGSISIGVDKVDTKAFEIRFEEIGNLIRSNSEMLKKIVYHYDPNTEDLKNTIKKINGILRSK